MSASSLPTNLESGASQGQLSPNEPEPPHHVCRGQRAQMLRLHQSCSHETPASFAFTCEVQRRVVLRMRALPRFVSEGRTTFDRVAWVASCDCTRTHFWLLHHQGRRKSGLNRLDCYVSLLNKKISGLYLPLYVVPCFVSCICLHFITCVTAVLLQFCTLILYVHYSYVV